MRNAFAKTITKLAATDQRIILLSGDIGNRLFNPFKERFSERFYNCGVAEANMTGIAAGLAMNGFRPITYTIASFNVYRCYEQIRLDICYQNLPVIIVGVGAGLSYASLGATHHSIEDIAIMSAIPNMNVICPGDAFEVEALLNEALKLNEPVYMRIGKKNEPLVYKSVPNVKIGKACIINSGKSVCIISTGNMLPIAVEAGNLLGAEVVNMHTVKPIDKQYLQNACEKFDKIITVEEHSIIGGLGSIVSDFIIDNNFKKVELEKVAVENKFLAGTGGQDEARQMLGLTIENIIKKAKN